MAIDSRVAHGNRPTACCLNDTGNIRKGGKKKNLRDSGHRPFGIGCKGPVLVVCVDISILMMELKDLFS